MKYKFYTLDNQLIKETDIWPPNFTGIVECPSGSKFWYLNRKRHKLDGPAVEFADGTKHWFINGKCHRLDGPAIECVGGTKIWCVDDKQITEEHHNLLHSIMKLKGLI